MRASYLLVGSAVAVFVAAEGGLRNFRPRTDFCGLDDDGIKWHCLEPNTKCCIGTLQNSCIPSSWTCCESGTFCAPSDSCVLNTTTEAHDCSVGDGIMGQGFLRRADNSTSSVDSGPKSNDDGESGSSDASSDGSSDDDSGAAGLLKASALSCVLLVGAAMAML